MKQTIIIHGSPDEEEFYNPQQPSQSNKHWFPWLQKELGVRDQICQALEYPKPYDPIYEKWVEVFEQLKWDDQSVLIGHSCGGGFLLRFLSEHSDLKPGKVILVAPWLDPEHELSTDFFKCEIDKDLTNRTQLHIFISSDDFEGVLKSIEIIREKLPNAIYHEFTNKGHFTKGDMGEEFPELLEILK